MTLDKDNRRKQPEQNRTQKIVMWSIFGIVGAMVVAAAIIFILSGARFF